MGDTCLCIKSTSPDGPYQLNSKCPLHGYTGDHMSEQGRTNYYREKDDIPINTPFTDYAREQQALQNMKISQLAPSIAEQAPCFHGIIGVCQQCEQIAERKAALNKGYNREVDVR